MQMRADAKLFFQLGVFANLSDARLLVNMYEAIHSPIQKPNYLSRKHAIFPSPVFQNHLPSIHSPPFTFHVKCWMCNFLAVGLCLTFDPAQ